MPEQKKPRTDRRYDRSAPNKRRNNTGNNRSANSSRPHSSKPASAAPNPAPSRPAPPPAPPKPIVPEFDFASQELEYVIVAEIATPFGLRGAVKANIQTDFPERFDRMEEAYLAPPGAPLDTPREKYNLLSARVQNEKQVVLRFEGVTKNEQAEMLRGYTVAVPRAEVVPLPEGEFYIFQIIGLEVYTTEDEYVGRVVNVEKMTANDIYLVRGPLSPKDVLIPAIKDVIKKIDLDEGRITIEWMEGLI